MTESTARENLDLTRQRFDAGVSDSVEVSQAAESVALAELDRITALFIHNLAKINVARSMGQAEQRLGEFLPVR